MFSFNVLTPHQFTSYYSPLYKSSNSNLAQAERVFATNANGAQKSFHNAYEASATPFEKNLAQGLLFLNTNLATIADQFNLSPQPHKTPQSSMKKV